MYCSKCGGSIIGDGYTCIKHCENAHEDSYYDHTPDGPVVECDYNEEHQMAIEAYINVYKSITGVRPRHINLNEMTTEEICRQTMELEHEEQADMPVSASSFDGVPDSPFAQLKDLRS